MVLEKMSVENQKLFQIRKEKERSFIKEQVSIPKNRV
jgi:hypothetical protein